MNPIEAMAKEICDVFYGVGDWNGASDKKREKCFNAARAARDTLAENVSDDMCAKLLNETRVEGSGIRDCLAAAIRAAGEE